MQSSVQINRYSDCYSQFHVKWRWHFRHRNFITFFVINIKQVSTSNTQKAYIWRVHCDVSMSHSGMILLTEKLKSDKQDNNAMISLLKYILNWLACVNGHLRINYKRFASTRTTTCSRLASRGVVCWTNHAMFRVNTRSFAMIQSSTSAFARLTYPVMKAPSRPMQGQVTVKAKASLYRVINQRNSSQMVKGRWRPGECLDDNVIVILLQQCKSDDSDAVVAQDRGIRSHATN